MINIIQEFRKYVLFIIYIDAARINFPRATDAQLQQILGLHLSGATDRNGGRQLRQKSIIQTDL